MKKSAILLIVISMVLSLSGCVSKSDYNTALEQITAAEEKISDQEQKLTEKEGKIQSLTTENEEQKEKISSLESELDELKQNYEALSKEYDELKNGGARRLVSIRNLMEQKDYNGVITAAAELHSLYNGSQEDVEGQQLAAAAQKELDDIAAAKAAAEKAAAEEVARSAKEKARAIIRVSKVSVSSPNSAGGVSLYIGFTNKSDKTIKYAEFTVVPYNAVGDRQYCDIRGYSTFTAEATGPYVPGKGIAGNSSYYWSCAWYNWSIKSVELTNIWIEYMDGTTVSLKGDDIGYVMY